MVPKQPEEVEVPAPVPQLQMDCLNPGCVLLDVGSAPGTAGCSLGLGCGRPRRSSTDPWRDLTGHGHVLAKPLGWER